MNNINSFKTKDSKNTHYGKHSIDNRFLTPPSNAVTIAVTIKMLLLLDRLEITNASIFINADKESLLRHVIS